MRPLVSVVTPFYNTADYLAECIESVLAQTHERFEYLLLDNCSTDGSRAIAESYARRDARIQLCRNDRLLPQVENYNAALAQISRHSEYCKIVQADDWIFPECLEKMVALAEQMPTMGVVSSYIIDERAVGYIGPPLAHRILTGRDACRMELLEDYFFFGAPTAVMFRSRVIRERTPFYATGRLYEDVEACYEALRTWDFGFVHQILSFRRTANESISSRVRHYHNWFLYKLILLEKYGRHFLSEDEFAKVRRRTRRDYFQSVAARALRGAPAGFWDYQRKGLEEIGYRLTSRGLSKYILWELADAVFNPKKTVGQFLARE